MFKALKFEVPRSAHEAGEGLPSWATPGKAGAGEGMARYFGMVKCIDDNVGKILAALREAGVADRTAVVFTSDHGDMCGEHGRYNKGIPLEASARIPFLVHAPGRVPPGTVVRQALGTVDFKPTILALLGVANPAPDEGRDASKLFTDPTAAKTWDDIAFIRIGGGPQRAAAGEDGDGPGWMGAFTRQYKFIVAPGADACLFDLDKDPEEMRNLINSPAHRETVRRLARALADYAKRSNEPHLIASRVKADLDWASNGTGEYPVSERATPKDGKRRKGKAAKGQ
jgi:arylsulfatase A-like enzyme